MVTLYKGFVSRLDRFLGRAGLQPHDFEGVALRPGHPVDLQTGAVVARQESVDVSAVVARVVGGTATVPGSE